MPCTIQTVHTELSGVTWKQRTDYSHSHAAGARMVGQPVLQQKGPDHKRQLSHPRQAACAGHGTWAGLRCPWFHWYNQPPVLASCPRAGHSAFPKYTGLALLPSHNLQTTDLVAQPQIIKHVTTAAHRLDVKEQAFEGCREEMQPALQS